MWSVSLRSSGGSVGAYTLAQAPTHLVVADDAGHRVIPQTDGKRVVAGAGNTGDDYRFRSKIHQQSPENSALGPTAKRRSIDKISRRIDKISPTSAA